MDNKLLAILVCPACGSELNLNKKELICTACKLAYPIEDNIPIMLIEQAREMSSDEVSKYE
jgi:uncharacterized protein YbaR (Trm112 family)